MVEIEDETENSRHAAFTSNESHENAGYQPFWELVKNSIQEMSHSAENLKSKHEKSMEKIQLLSQQNLALENSIGTMQPLIQGITISGTAVRSSLSSFKNKLDGLPLISYNSTFIWRISDFPNQLGKKTNYFRELNSFQNVIVTDSIQR